MVFAADGSISQRRTSIAEYASSSESSAISGMDASGEWFVQNVIQDFSQHCYGYNVYMHMRSLQCIYCYWYNVCMHMRSVQYVGSRGLGFRAWGLEFRVWGLEVDLGTASGIGLKV